MELLTIISLIIIGFASGCTLAFYIIDTNDNSSEYIESIQLRDDLIKVLEKRIRLSNELINKQAERINFLENYIK